MNFSCQRVKYICLRVLIANMAEPTTSVRLKNDTWSRLNRMKNPGDSFDDVIGRLFEVYDEYEVDKKGSRPVPDAYPNR